MERLTCQCGEQGWAISDETVFCNNEDCDLSVEMHDLVNRGVEQLNQLMKEKD